MLSTDPIAKALRARVPIAALVGETVELVRVGDELRGECPAHPDPDSGLFVNQALGLYRCFSCGRGGDVVQWVRETARCSEEAAMAILSRRVA